MKAPVTLIPVLAGIRHSLGNHPVVQRWVNPAAIAQIYTVEHGLHVALNNGGGLDVIGRAESESFLAKLGITASVAVKGEVR